MFKMYLVNYKQYKLQNSFIGVVKNIPNFTSHIIFLFCYFLSGISHPCNFKTLQDHGSECSEDDSAYEELFKTVMTAADMEGRPLSTMFQLLPSRTVSKNFLL